MKDLKLHFQVVKLLLLIPNSGFKLMKALSLEQSEVLMGLMVSPEDLK